MTLRIDKVADKGFHQKERLILQVTSDIDVGDFVILQTGRDDTTPTSFVYRAFWFPDIEVKVGDLVVVYTKPGSQKTKSFGEGRHTYFFYWGLKQAIWDSEDRCAVVLHAPVWSWKVSTDL